MARVKLSEYDAKRLLFPALNLDFHGLALTANNYQSVISSPASPAGRLPRDLVDTNLVVKVDQGIKKRGKLGLVKVNCTSIQVVEAIKSWSPTWSHFFVEPVYEHAESAEHYLAIERTREGWAVSYSAKGGIEVEKSWNSVKRTVLKRNSRLQAEKGSSADERTVLKGIEMLVPALVKLHIVFLECNPVLVRDGKLIPLDMAAEVDSAALGRGEDFSPVPDRTVSDSEAAVAALDATTPASLKFRLINPDGKIWMFLSGGGASLVLADEVADQGMGKELANYGEYSGAPTDDDVYAYTKIILQAIIHNSNPNPRAIIIAGGVANFTDVEKTFRGLIRALDEQKAALAKAQVKIFVRRGGPNEVKGLKMMEDFLRESNLLGSVHGHDAPLTQVVTEVKEYLQ